MENEYVEITVDIDKDILKRIKYIARLQNKAVEECIGEMIKEYMEGTE
ncbi:MAG: hypothetical protein IJ306_06120 [Oscillospiraceae bacterium]|nr:hypothetical protein [Oscillospiraceae bacterium]